MTREEFAQMLEDGMALLHRERTLCLEGALGQLGPIAEEKTALLARLEGAARPEGLDRQLLGGLRALVAQAQRNEKLLASLRQGVAAARRRACALAELRAGAVAYWRDGTRVISREDAARKSTRA